MEKSMLVIILDIATEYTDATAVQGNTAPTSAVAINKIMGRVKPQLAYSGDMAPLQNTFEEFCFSWEASTAGVSQSRGSTAVQESSLIDRDCQFFGI